MKKTNALAGWLCGLVTLLCMVAIQPRVEMGVNDDWSYIFTAKRLAETGHIFYNGWASPFLGLQLYLGALFIRILGFSFTHARLSVMLLSVLAAPLMHALLVRSGIRAWNATFATLVLTLSPLYLLLETSFMSDADAMFFTVLFFYAAVRCAQAETDRTALLWMGAACVAGVLGGSVRQTVFLCVLLSMPSLAWQQRRRRGMLPLATVLWALSAAIVLGLTHWFSHQTYTAVERPWFRPHDVRGVLLVVDRLLKSTGTVLLLLSPVLLGVALKFPWRDRRRLLAFLLGAVAVVSVVATWRFGSAWWGRWLIGDYVTARGILWWEPDTLGLPIFHVPLGVQVAIAVLVFACTVVAAATFVLRWRSSDRWAPTPTDAALLSTVLPFLAAYLMLVFTRFSVYDRYFVPVMLFAMLGMLRWFELRFAARLPVLALLPLALLGAFGVAGTHDFYAGARARLAAINEVRNTAVARADMRGGFEYDGWTQLELTGYVNEPRLHPAGIYQKNTVPTALNNVHPSARYSASLTGPNDPGQCIDWFYLLTPSIHAHYVLQNQPGFCFADAPLPSVTYRTWLAPHVRTIYIAQVPQPLW